jgi:hypothetical protein
LAVPRLINASIVGWSSDDATTRCIGYRAPISGFWTQYFKRVLDDVRATNPMLPHIVWNPGGCLPGEPMQFTQMIQAERAGFSWLTDDLERSILDYAHNAGRLGFYLGGEADDRVLKSYYANSTKDRIIRDATRRLPRCCAIAVDAASGSAKDSRVLRWMCMEQDAGREVLSEALPSTPLMDRFGAIMTRWFSENFRAWPGVHPSPIETILCDFDRILMPPDASEAFGKGWSLCGSIDPSNWLGVAPRSRLRHPSAFRTFMKHYRAAHIAKSPQS